jgi:glutamate--cysteine ligase
MSTRATSSEDNPVVTSKTELVDWIAAGAKPPSHWRIGTEHEKILYATDTHASVPYDGPRGVRALLDGLAAQFGWEPVREGDAVIALRAPEGTRHGGISLEPGGQFELSGAPLETLHDVAAETDQHLADVAAVSGPLGIGMLGIGFDPLHRLADMPTMPKARYGIMQRYMPTVGDLGLDMMHRTATIQVNLDFADEADMVRKLQVSLALQPIAQALFAASPFVEGRPSGFKSMRGEVWRRTDAARSGNLPFAFEPGMGFERYVDYALDVPMYFVYRDGHFIDVAGASFRDFMTGRLVHNSSDPRLHGLVATIDDWSDHLTTLFPDVRLKRFLEMRGADAGPAAHIVALPAFWTGLLYDGTSLDAAHDLVKSWTQDERQMLRDLVPRHALATPFRSGQLIDVAREAVAIARAGLVARQRFDASGHDETGTLAPLEAIVADGQTRADRWLDLFDGRWGGDLHRGLDDLRIV